MTHYAFQILVSVALLVVFGSAFTHVGSPPAADPPRIFLRTSSWPLEGPQCSAELCRPQSTCCSVDDSFQCCPHANATCCGYKDLCCSPKTVCDPPTMQCVPVEDANSTQCTSCFLAVTFLATKGCSSACKLLPAPADSVCSFLTSLGICENLTKWITNGLSPRSICQSFGICSGGTCSCGYCTRYTYGRCLSFPNHCPSNPTPTPSAPLSLTEGAEKRAALYCWNGVCDEGTEGCCTTCF